MNPHQKTVAAIGAFLLLFVMFTVYRSQLKSILLVPGPSSSANGSSSSGGGSLGIIGGVGGALGDLGKLGSGVPFWDLSTGPGANTNAMPTVAPITPGATVSAT